MVLASQGVRIWTAECRVESFDGVFHLSCSDATTLENLRHQQRVAFTYLGPESERAVQGSGTARISADADGSGAAAIRMEPYRVSVAGGQAFELRLGGWRQVNEAATPMASGFAFWYQAFRAVTMTLSILPVLVGTAAAFAGGRFNPLLFAMALVGAMAAHAGANATADYFDFKNGVDLSRALSSHLGALAREKVEPEKILFAAFGCFLVVAVIGVALVQVVRWPILLFGFAGLAGAFFYTGKPFSYKYRATGELMLGILMGPVIVMGSYYVQTLTWNWAVFVISVALAMLVSSASLANNLRDLPDDRDAGIRTLPMILGVAGTKKLYYFLTAAPYLLMAAAVGLNHVFWPVALVAISLPQAVKTIQALRDTGDNIEDIRQKSPKRPYPLYSIQLHARFTFIVALSIAVAGVLRLVG